MAVVSKPYIVRNKDGFTIVELILVVVILGILAGLVYPQAASIISSQRLQSTAKEIMSDMRMAQQLAISKELTIQMVFRHSGSSLPNTYIIKPSPYTSTLKTVELPDGVDIIEAVFGRNHDNKFVLGTLGLPTPNGHVKLSNNAGQSLWIIVYQTGRIRISDEPPK